MNAAEAREIVDLWTFPSDVSVRELPERARVLSKKLGFYYSSDSYFAAKSYLEALEGEEVKALVEAIEKLQEYNGVNGSYERTKKICEIALTIYRKAIEK